jgi:peptidoglycan/xylan/chitin deacetylase (PgdA/CDA1 family)
MNRTAFAAALDRLRVPHVAMALRRTGSRWITVLTYHSVAQGEGVGVSSGHLEHDETGLRDDGVVDVTADQFDRQLAFIKRWFSPIGVRDLLAHTRAGKPLPSNPLLVTFDDGYRDNHDLALPILLRHGVRATFFVATEFVDRRRPFWWDLVSLVMKRARREKLELEYPERVTLVLEPAPAARGAAIRSALRIIKDRRGLSLERFLGELQRATGVALSAADERKLAERTVMTWEQVVALRRAGMDVQSHTSTHRVLQTLTSAELERELRGSRSVLEDVLGEPIRAISYPVGKPLRTAPSVRRAVRDAGYELGFSNGTGVNVAPLVDPLDVRRVSLDADLSDGFFRAMLALPWLAY